MKEKILIGSLVSSGVATGLGVVSIVTGSSLAWGLAGIVGLMGIASFFVGYAFPGEQIQTSTYGNGKPGPVYKTKGVR